MLNEIIKKKYKNVLLPSLGTGSYGFEHEDVGHKVYTILKNCVNDNDVNITLVLGEPSVLAFYK